ncbi:MAG: carbohydrate ABC transporter permease [Spirochaetaceae bacterium]
MTISKKISSARFHIFAMVLAIVMFYPVVWLIFATLKNQSEIFRSGIDLIPDKITLKNYITAFTGIGEYNFLHFMKNSLIISVYSVIGTVLSSAVIAFGFARIEFKGRKFFFMCMMATLMLPYQIIMVPQYVIFNKLNWVNTFLPIIVPTFLGEAFFIFLAIQFIRSIPKELDEAAFIDGASVYKTFSLIIFPLLKTPLITIAIFKFYWSWEQFLQPMIYLNKIQLYPIPVALGMWSDPGSGTNYGALLAMGFLSLVPVVLVFILLQRYIVEGVNSQGLKG